MGSAGRKDVREDLAPPAFEQEIPELPSQPLGGVGRLGFRRVRNPDLFRPLDGEHPAFQSKSSAGDRNGVGRYGNLAAPVEALQNSALR